MKYKKLLNNNNFPMLIKEENNLTYIVTEEEAVEELNKLYKENIILKEVISLIAKDIKLTEDEEIVYLNNAKKHIENNGLVEVAKKILKEHKKAFEELGK